MGKTYKKQRKRPYRSDAQKAHTRSMSSGNKENVQPGPAVESTTSRNSVSVDHDAALRKTRTKLYNCRWEVKKTRATILKLKLDNQSLREQLDTSQSEEQALRISLTSMTDELHTMQIRAGHISDKLARATRSIQAGNSYLCWIENELSQVRALSSEALLQHREQIKKLHKKIDAARQREKRHSSLSSQSLKRQLKKHQCLSLKVKGVYTARSRSLARTLVQAGCAEKEVGKTIVMLGKLMGIEVKHKMSKRSVRRAILEGGVAATIQIGHSIASAISLTFSSDGTSHCHINYESRHIAVRQSMNETPRIYFLGVNASTDHSSNTQYEGWMRAIENAVQTYVSSPLAQRCGLTLTENDVAAKLTGLNGDHANDVGRLFSLLSTWKKHCAQVVLGNRKLATMNQIEFVITMGLALKERIELVGGNEKWLALDSGARAEHETAMVKEIAMRLGQENYANLSEQERRVYEVFFQGGCCMHKDLNAVKGGDKAMTPWWSTANVPGPLLLTNKDNAAVLRDSTASKTDAGRHIELFSGRGGTKLTMLAGLIFNHKDKKKGQQNTYNWFFFHALGYAVQFPDTSNTRYGSHCEAAAELIAHLPVYIKLMEHVRDKKEKPGFTNIELNVYHGLKDLPTLSELCVLAAYGQAISHPYIRSVRGPESASVNVLDLGPLHEHVKAHIRMLIEKPELVFSMSSTPIMSSLDGKQWERPEAFYALQALLPHLPHTIELFVAFLKGALETWERFTDEYQPGSEIDLATEEERARAWMPTTNDRNEGALGSMRQNARRRSNHSSLSYNSQTAYKQNDTEEFMEETLNTEEDHKYLRKTARVLDAAKLQANLQRQQIDHDEAAVKEKRRKMEEKKRKLREVADALDKVEMILDYTSLEKMINSQLDEQLNKYRQIPFMKDHVPSKSATTRKQQKLEALAKCIELYKESSGTMCSSDEFLDENVNNYNDNLDMDSDLEMDID